ncbi:ABC transporter substrate-binding protein [Nonomuraea sp. SBT364]|uniref:ABC transporter substrate-binding protein n=1 Tax=Nonomuraea sp. SBT364 TaxID=1580530 RepID=UPI0018CF8F49|nr:ABC transporter substrate-binding protein [Nonomuraea sp. SBT364]
MIPRTGRLARLGDPLSFLIPWLAPQLTHIVNGSRRYALRVAIRDSRSDPAHARRAVRELVDHERAHVVITMAGTRVLPAVVAACEELGAPCVSTTFPWQAYVHRPGAAEPERFDWAYHFAWGLDDIATVFAEIWERLGPARTVGCLWNDDVQGRLLRHDRDGFAPVARKRGHTLIDPGGYAEPATDLSDHVDHLRRHSTEIITSAATASDLALFHRQACESRLRPRLITCSRWLAYPHAGVTGGAELAEARVGTLVYWTPRHPYRSSLDGTTAAGLAAAYEQATGKAWLQPLGLAHALIEVACHALSHAADPADRHAVARALSRTHITTMAGSLDWTSGPTPNIALVPLAGGQWQPTRHGHDLAVVTNTGLPEVPITGDLVVAP